MRTFKSFNNSNDTVCPICKTGEEKETLLVPVLGTQDGNISEAIQIHSECLQNRLTYDPKYKLVYARCE